MEVFAKGWRVECVVPSAVGAEEECVVRKPGRAILVVLDNRTQATAAMIAMGDANWTDPVGDARACEILTEIAASADTPAAIRELCRSEQDLLDEAAGHHLCRFPHEKASLYSEHPWRCGKCGHRYLYSQPADTWADVTTMSDAAAVDSRRAA